MAAFADEVLQRDVLFSRQQSYHRFTIEKTLHVSLAGQQRSRRFLPPGFRFTVLTLIVRKNGSKPAKPGRNRFPDRAGLAQDFGA